MEMVRLGKTELMVTKTSFGALPIQRRCKEDAIKILRRAYDSGINYFDTANGYTDSEEKIGEALSDVRQNIIISTKSKGEDKKTVAEEIELSLKRMKTDYIDLFQFHNLPFLPHPDDPDGPYAAALEAKKKGYIRHIGLTLHPTDMAFQSIESGLYETLQFPFSYISSDKELTLPQKCAEADMGFIAMKGLAGGLLKSARACHAFMAQFDNVVPIWGIQSIEELDEWLALAQENPGLDDELNKIIESDKKELQGGFCRCCGYCMPCPVGIEIRNAARMNMLLRRSPWKRLYSPKEREKMERIKDCINCGQCVSKCPYGLDIPNLLKYMLEDYYNFYEEHKHELEEA